MLLTMNFLWIFWLFSCFIESVSGFEQRADCVDFCSHLETSQEFGDCLSQCSRKPKKDNVGDSTVFASPPFNVRVETRVVMDEGKILESTIKWNADDSDLLRSGFYIRYTALNSTCQKNFPGFFTSSVSASERSLTIPAAFNGHSLIIDHSCTYLLQIKSIPYPAGDESYIITNKHTVPECIDKYCSCRDDDVAEIENLKIDDSELTWNFKGKEDREYSFFVDVFEKIPMPKFKSEKKNSEEFTFQIANSEPFEVSGKNSKTSLPNHFKFSIPFNFQQQQYRISIFAVDDHFCHNSDAFLVFNATNSTIIQNPEPIALNTPAMSNNLGSNKNENAKQLDKEIMSKSVLMESTAFLVILLAVACMSPLCTVIVLFVLKRRNNDKKQQDRFLNRRSISCSRHSIMETNILYRPPQEVGSVTEWQIRGQDIVVGTVIGEGAFGLVFKGILRGPNGQVVRVAVKQLKANAVDEEKEEFVREIQMMQTVGQHDNIVTMYGYCMDENLQCMIMEYVPFGDLKHYLQNLRKQLAFTASTSSEMPTQTPEPEMDYIELLSFSQQIAQGMAHLESLGIIHRDLAARNILVGNGKVLKISDFGMSRPGVYIKMSKGVIPLRWLSPEAIKENTYSTKSDVWAYGVLLWEMTTLGGFPYENIADKDIHSKLMDGHRLEKPTKCSDEIYNLMKSCWTIELRDRPTFHMIFQILSQLACQPMNNAPEQMQAQDEISKPSV